MRGLLPSAGAIMALVSPWTRCGMRVMFIRMNRVQRGRHPAPAPGSQRHVCGSCVLNAYAYASVCYPSSLAVTSLGRLSRSTVVHSCDMLLVWGGVPELFLKFQLMIRSL